MSKKINLVLEGKFKDEKIYGSTFSDGFKISTWSANKKIFPPTPSLMKLTKTNIPFGKVLWE